MKTLYVVAAAASFIVAWSPSGAQPASPCDRLAGAEQRRCLAEQKGERDPVGRDEAGKPRTCDTLVGPERELCLKRGGTVRAGTDSPGAAGGYAAPDGSLAPCARTTSKSS
jgi:hypothetical protein